jgi:hypothetical protein
MKHHPAMSERARVPKPRLLTLDAKYLTAAVLLLLVEIFIALRVHDAWVRPYGGDVLVVILLYCLVRSFLNLPVVATALGVLAFSYVVEILQYFRFVDRVGLRDDRLAVVVIGSSFEWLDLVSYTLGVALVLLFERILARSRPSPS